MDHPPERRTVRRHPRLQKHLHAAPRARSVRRRRPVLRHPLDPLADPRPPRRQLRPYPPARRCPPPENRARSERPHHFIVSRIHQPASRRHRRHIPGNQPQRVRIDRSHRRIHHLDFLARIPPLQQGLQHPRKPERRLRIPQRRRFAKHHIPTHRHRRATRHSPIRRTVIRSVRRMVHQPDRLRTARHRPREKQPRKSIVVTPPPVATHQKPRVMTDTRHPQPGLEQAEKRGYGTGDQ